MSTFAQCQGAECSYCGNGIVETPNSNGEYEECDVPVGGIGSAGCVSCQIQSGRQCTNNGTTCTPICGDGIVVGNEQCDPADPTQTNRGDAGCGAAGTANQCKKLYNICLGSQCIESTLPPNNTNRPSCANNTPCPVCGDGILDSPYEQCDPADPTQTGRGSAGCSVSCVPLAPPPPPSRSCDIDFGSSPLTQQYYSGDTIKFSLSFPNVNTGVTVYLKKGQFGDIFVDSRTWNNEADYLSDPSVSNGIFTTPYIAQPSDKTYRLYINNNNSSCDSARVRRCGDGLTEPGKEQCDDGNTNNDDACNNTCDGGSGTCSGPLCGDQVAQCPEGKDLTTEFDILVVLDNSRSMVHPAVNTEPFSTNTCYNSGGCKFNAQWDAIETLITMIDTTKNRVGMISFSSDKPNSGNQYNNDHEGVRIEYALAPYTPDFYTAIRAHANDNDSWYTNLGLVLREVQNYIIQYADPARPLEIIFLTDGSPTRGTQRDPEGSTVFPPGVSVPDAFCTNCYENYDFALSKADALQQFLENSNYTVRVWAVGYDVENDNPEITMQDVEILLRDHIASAPQYYQHVSLNDDLTSIYTGIFSRYCGCDPYVDPNCSGCGDGIVDRDGPDDDITTTIDNEECDRGTGNVVSGPGCRMDCTFVGPGCGDGVVDDGEECDPGIDGSGYTGGGSCLTPQCCIDLDNNGLCDSSEIPVCGNAVVENDEECDDGINDGSGQAQCSSGYACNACLCTPSGNASCESLVLSPNEGNVPLAVDMNCSGDGDIFEIVVYDDTGNQIVSESSSNPFVRQYTFDTPGEYFVFCFVDNQTLLDCPDLLGSNAPTSFSTQSVIVPKKGYDIVGSDVQEENVNKNNNHVFNTGKDQEIIGKNENLSPPKFVDKQGISDILGTTQEIFDTLIQDMLKDIVREDTLEIGAGKLIETGYDTPSIIINSFDQEIVKVQQNDPGKQIQTCSACVQSLSVYDSNDCQNPVYVAMYPELCVPYCEDEEYALSFPDLCTCNNSVFFDMYPERCVSSCQWCGGDNPFSNPDIYGVLQNSSCPVKTVETVLYQDTRSLLFTYGCDSSDTGLPTVQIFACDASLLCSQGGNIDTMQQCIVDDIVSGVVIYENGVNMCTQNDCDDPTFVRENPDICCVGDDICNVSCEEDPDCDYACDTGSCIARDNDLSDDDFDTRYECNQSRRDSNDDGVFDACSDTCDTDGWCNVSCPLGTDPDCAYECDATSGTCIAVSPPASYGTGLDGFNACQQACTLNPGCPPGQACVCGDNILDDTEECELVDGNIVWQAGYPQGSATTCNTSTCQGYCANCGNNGGNNFCGDGKVNTTQGVVQCIQNQGGDLTGSQCSDITDCDTGQQCVQINAGLNVCIASNIVKQCATGGTEQCDDGNGFDGDGCSKNCYQEGGNSGGGGGGGGNCNTNKNPIFRAKYCDDGAVPKCAAVDPPSLQVGEYLPFWWDLELQRSGGGSYNFVEVCTEENIGSIAISDMLCQFTLYNGKYCDDPGSCLGGGHGVKRIWVPCFADKGQWYRADHTDPGRLLAGEKTAPLFADFLNEVNQWMGRAYFKLDESITNGVLGEYKISLDAVRYRVCGKEYGPGQYEKESSRVCEYNFPVGDGFILHKTALDTVSNTNLDMYVDIYGQSVVKRFVNTVTQGTVQYQGKTVKDLASQFANEYSALASQTLKSGDKNLPFIVVNQGVHFKKVPNQEIYIYDKNAPENMSYFGRTLEIQGKAGAKPYALIVKNARLALKGNMDTSAIYVVPDDKVIFVDSDCDSTQIVQGMFMSGGGFTTPRIRNDRLQNEQRCEDGRLVIEGQLVGPRGIGIGSLGSETGRRSKLEYRFDAGNGTREEDVLRSAALLIKNNPKMWTKKIPGIKFFGESIKTLKR